MLGELFPCPAGVRVTHVINPLNQTVYELPSQILIWVGMHVGMYRATINQVVDDDAVVVAYLGAHSSIGSSIAVSLIDSLSLFSFSLPRY